jgi:hypothetical protein
MKLSKMNSGLSFLVLELEESTKAPTPTSLPAFQHPFIFI